jgi:hypothetical protein
MTALLQKLGYGLHVLPKNAGFTVVAVMTLALGIGATTAIHSVLYATFLAPMPYPNPGQMVIVWSKIAGEHNGVSAGDFLDWKRQSTVFPGLNAWTDGTSSTAFMLAAGLIVGLGLSIALSRVVRAWAGGNPRDPLTLLSAAVVLVLVSVVASVVPAWRAASLDPAVALRYE